MGASLAPLDIAVNVALPAITAHFRLALGDVQWLVICYVLVYGSLMLVCGKLGDLFGHRLIFRIGLAVSAIGCAACAARARLAARSLGARRAGHRHGAGDLLHAGARHLAVSAGAATAALAGFALTHVARLRDRAAAGRRAGRDCGGWPAVYWIRVPVALVALATVGPAAAPDRSIAAAVRFWGGVLLATIMSTLLAALVFAQRTRCRHWLAVACSLALAARAVAAVREAQPHCRRADHPAGPVRRPDFTIPNVMNLFASLAAFSILLLTPYYLVNVLKPRRLAVGLVLALASSPASAGAPLAARLVPLLGRRPTWPSPASSSLAWPLLGRSA